MNQAASDDDLKRWHQSRSRIFRRGSSKRAVNVNFLFFCQIVLLVIPITFLYAGLYFMNVSYPIIIFVCGVLIFGFLIVVFCVQPFTNTEQAKGEDTIPLTLDLPPSRKPSHAPRTVTGGAEGQQQVPSSQHRTPKNCPLPDSMPREHHSVNRSTVETKNHGDGEESGSSNSTLPCRRDSFCRCSSSSSSVENAKSCSAQKKRLKSCHAENSVSSSTPIENIEKECSSNDSKELRKKHFGDEDIDLLHFPAQHTKDCVLSSKEGSRRAKHCKVDFVSTPTPCKVRPLSTESKSNKKISDSCSSRSQPSPILKRVLRSDSDENLYKKQKKPPSENTSAKAKPGPSISTIEKEQILSSTYFNWNKDKSTETPITIRLFPVSSRQGIFELADPKRSPQHDNLLDVGFNNVICNMQKIGMVEGSNDTVDGSSQTMLPLNTNTVPQMMVSSLEDKVKQVEDKDTQNQVEIPEISPNPSTIVYVVDETKDFKSKYCAKSQKSEMIQCRLSESNQSSIEYPDEDSSNCHKTNDNQQKSLKSSTGRNNSILDFVLRRPFSRDENRIENAERPKTAGSFFPKSKEQADATGSVKNNDKSTSYDKIVCESTISSLVSSTPRMLTSSFSSREVVEGDSRSLEVKDESWKIQAKVFSPNKKLKRDDDVSKEFYMSLYMGGKDKKYQPSRLGLLATESSKEEVAHGKSNAISPRTKKKVKVKQDYYLNDCTRKLVDEELKQSSPNFDKNTHKSKECELLRSMTNCEVRNDCGQYVPGSCDQYISHNRIPGVYQRSPRKKSPDNNRTPNSPVKHKSPAMPSRTAQNKDKQPTKHESKRRRSSFPPFNLDFSSSVNDEDNAHVSPKTRRSNQKEPHIRKRRPGDSRLTDPEKFRSPDGSPTRNKNRRISHRVESTLLKKSSSSYNNVTIERIIKQKKKTLKKFK